ncbi:YkgJ family cysteine cluster protein [Chitinilyticum aquatile]|uniref:YkgJ family cysteine cluster protein n=1 Tax=Chitinilyticum aquatile TaxID=362520 RepID=UPI00040F4EDC|nr:YkgJ family cysteine cluster protein [Chitinilyticum aquatile]
MTQKLIYLATLERLDTWIKYRSSLCADCQATCCTMPAEVKLPDLVRMGVVDPFEAEHEQPKTIARRLEKAGIIEHFNFKQSIFTLARMANGDCRYLDTATRRCTIYELRPNTCRNHPKIGPRPGYCAYRHKA